MKANTPRQKAIHKAIRELIPQVPYADFLPIATAARAKHMRSLTPVNGAYLATVAHIRHQHTDYDELRDEGYDHDSARYFVADDIEDRWGGCRPPSTASQCAMIVVFSTTEQKGRQP